MDLWKTGTLGGGRWFITLIKQGTLELQRTYSSG